MRQLPLPIDDLSNEFYNSILFTAPEHGETHREDIILNDILGDWKRTDYCGSLVAGDIGREVCLMGWVQRRRDHGGLIFIDLRDREGIAQLALDPDRDSEAHAKADTVRSEYVIAITGKVSP